MGNCACLKRNDKDFDIYDEKPEKNTPICNPQEQPQQTQKLQNLQSCHSVPQRKKIKETVNLRKSHTVEGEKKLNDYILKQVLGQGTFGKVRLAEKNQQKFAVKILNKNRLKKKREYYTDSNGVVKIKNAFENVAREIAIMKKLRHSNIIRLYEIIDSPNSNKIYMVMEYAQKGQLIEWDEETQQFILTSKDFNINELNLRRISRDVIKGLYQMHDLGIVHRDLKPQNILFDKQFKAKICDFGVSQIINGDTEHYGTSGTYLFMAPECFEDGKFDRKAADIWSLGITLYAFAFLKVPYVGEDIQQIMEQIQTKEIDYSQCSKGFKEFLLKCLEKDPQNRATIKDLTEDDWINEGCDVDLKSEIKSKLIKIEVDETEIQEAYSLATFILIKNWVTKIKHH